MLSFNTFNIAKSLTGIYLFLSSIVEITLSMMQRVIANELGLPCNSWLFHVQLVC